MAMGAQKLNTIKKELVQKASLLEKNLLQSTENLINDDPLYADTVDQASADAGRDITVRIKNRDRDSLVLIKEALRRIESGAFGECQNCGEDISLPRLRANPATTLCIDCAAELESHSQRYTVRN